MTFLLDADLALLECFLVLAFLLLDSANHVLFVLLEVFSLCLGRV